MKGREASTCVQWPDCGKVQRLVRGRWGGENGDDEAGETGRRQMMEILNGGWWLGLNDVSERQKQKKWKTTEMKREGWGPRH